MKDEIKEIISMSADEDIENRTQKFETIYTIIPSKVNEEDLFYYITHELSFDKVLGLYILLRTAISTGKLGSDDNE